MKIPVLNQRQVNRIRKSVALRRKLSAKALAHRMGVTERTVIEVSRPRSTYVCREAHFAKYPRHGKSPTIGRWHPRQNNI